jgi:hypothetical protein
MTPKKAVTFHIMWRGLSHIMWRKNSVKLSQSPMARGRGVARSSTLFYDRLANKKLCQHYTCLGKDVQERQRYFKEFAHAAATRSTFIFGKVVRRASPCTAQEAETEPRRTRLSPTGGSGL